MKIGDNVRINAKASIYNGDMIEIGGDAVWIEERWR
jgi:acetyltransferase-like isoleucine patch superfamily enzyme